MKYYTTDRIKKENAYYNVIFGGRSNGKSTALCKDLIDDYFRDGSQFGRVVRYITDVQQTVMAEWFGQEYLRNYTARKYNREIQFMADSWYVIPIGEDVYKYKERERIGRIFVLNSEYRYKSGQFEEVKKLVVEEFCLMDMNGYVPYEFEHFLSLISTINRHRTDLSVWLLGNTLQKSNPYFSGLGINIDKLKIYPGQLRTMRNRYGVKYAIEYAEMSYDSMDEVPDILKLDGNEIAFVGDFAIDSNVYPSGKLSNFLQTASPAYCCTFQHKQNFWSMYKISLTPVQPGFAIITGRYKASDEILIRLDNRLIDIDRKRGKTMKYLREIGYDPALTLYESEEIKYQVNTSYKQLTKI